MELTIQKREVEQAMSLKEDLLLELQAGGGVALSERALALKWGVSPDALACAAAALRREGHTVSFAADDPDGLGGDGFSADAVKRALPPELNDLPVYFYREIDSTNDEAKRRLARGLDEEALIVSERQTAGRGRNGHTFFSPATGAYMTMVLHLAGSPTDTVCVTTAAGVAVVRAVEALTDQHPAIKWVNDIFLDGRKIAGILAEAVGTPGKGGTRRVIVGIGLNVGPTEFPAQLRETAGSLDAGGVPRGALVAGIVGRLWHMSRNLAERSFMEDYRRHSLVLGRQIEYLRDGRTHRATALGIDDDGGLIVQDETGARTVLQSGEISLRKW